MALHLVQAGSGAHRLLVVAYFIADQHALLQSLPASACVLIDVDNPSGRFARAPGAGGVDSFGEVLAFARSHAGAEDVGPTVMIGWSAGCQAVREQLRAGATPDAVLALDGTSGRVPPTTAQLDPWRAAAGRARRGESLLVLTHTGQTYTEKLPVADRYLSTLSGCRMITGYPLEDAGPVTDPVIVREEGLVVASYRSATIDGEAHKQQQAIALPDLLRRIVVPWLRDHRDDPDTAPPTPRDPSVAPPPPRAELPPQPELESVLRVGSQGRDVQVWQALLRAKGYVIAADGIFGAGTDAATRAFQRSAGLTEDGVVGPKTRAAATASSGTSPPPLPGASGLGARVLEQARAALAAGVREVPPGSNRGPEIDAFLRGCVRGGKLLGVLGVAWCAASASDWVWVGFFPDGGGAPLAWTGEGARATFGALPPIGRRAAVAELCADARASGAWRERDAVPSPGWLAIYKRGGHDPRHGEEGHVAVVESWDVHGYVTIAGNEGDRVRRTARNLAAETPGDELVGWLAIG